MFEHQAQHMLGMVDCPVAPRWQCNWMVNLWICTFCYWWYRPNQTVYRSLPNHSLAISQSLPWILWQQNTRWIINSVAFDGKMINANRRTERKKNIFCLALAIHINGMLLMICNSRDSIVTIAMLSSYSFDGILRVTLTQYVAHTLIIIMMMTMVVVVVVVYACICQLAFSASECVSARMNKGSRCTDAS